MKVIKRDGSIEDYNFIKIKQAIIKAFDACKTPIPSTFVPLKNDIKSLFTSTDKVHVETIQDAVERYLMSKGHFDVAKAYIIYREKHNESRIIGDKLNYIHKYSHSNKNAATLSNTDDNANASVKTAAAADGEVYKDLNRRIQRANMKKLLELTNSPYVNQYIKDLESGIIYQHDEASSPVLKPYCSAYSLYPLLQDGTSAVDGTKNHAPRHLSSFCGQFCNLVFLLSSQKKGAGAYAEFFNVFSYFCEKEWGKDYYKNEDAIISSANCLEKRTIKQEIAQYFQQVTHYINQPAGNRSNQSPFTNFNVFDSYYWHSMFDEFVFPDGSKANWEAVNWLQKFYMEWLNEERTHTLLTFPVMTVCLLTNGKQAKDKEYEDFVTKQWAKGDSFFVYLSKNADSVASCCRLRNEINDNTFSCTTGLTGVQTGSCNVMTLNLNHIVQDWARQEKIKYLYGNLNDEQYVSLCKYLNTILLRVKDYQIAYKTGLYDLAEHGMFPQVTAGYINFKKLYSTTGVNGLNEAARFFGLEVSNNEAYMKFVTTILGFIKNFNKANSTPKFLFNLELVPAESLGVKNYNKDKSMGYWVPDDENLYNSYIYDAHDTTSILDKIAMQGGEVANSIDGGQASHLNLSENLSQEQYRKLLNYAIEVGNSYITFNVPQTQCDDCSFIAKHPFTVCPKCGSNRVTYWTRIIGYLRPTKTWGEARQIEGKKRNFIGSDNSNNEVL